MKRMRVIFGVIFAVVFILASVGTSFGEQFFEKHELKTFKGEKWAPGEILVKFKKSVSESTAQQMNQKNGAAVLSKSKRGGFLRLRVPPTKTVEEMVKIYSHNPNIEYAEPNFIATELFVPNDPYYRYQWNFDNDSTGGIHMESAWNIQTGARGVVVAVVDTGVAYENYGRKYAIAPDLAETSFVQGYDFVNNDSHPNDDEGHGTHVTGTIAQSTNNGVGVAGIAFNVSIMPVKVLNSSGSGSYSGIADGIYYAADNGADVINMSLGGPSSSTTLRDAVAYAYNKGVTIVCAAGNEYQSGNAPSYPAAYDEYCIAVGATRFDETRSYYSNTGSYVDIAAPGGDTSVDQNGDGHVDGILQQTFGNRTTSFGYYFYQGTSMASPHVAGVAALLISKGVTGPANVRQALEKTARDKGDPGWDPEYGWGIVDAYAALNYNSGTQVHDVAITDVSNPAQAVQGDTVAVIVALANQGDINESFTVSLRDATDAMTIGSQSVSLSSKHTSNLTFNWDTVSASAGSHEIIAQTSPIDGETDTSDNQKSSTIEIINQSSQLKIHVETITMDISTKRSNYQAIAHVSVFDEFGNAVSGVTVTGDWTLNDNYLNSASNVTGSFGSADLVSKKVRNASGDKFAITITGLSKTGCIYDSDNNKETTDSITP